MTSKDKAVKELTASGDGAGDVFDAEIGEMVRMAEALVFASSEPVSQKVLMERLPKQADVPTIMAHLKQIYLGRGVQLKQVGDAWAFRTAPDLAFLMTMEAVHKKRLSRAAMEVLAIIAYHQPVTRAEMEEVRGVETSKGTLDTLLETRWVQLRGRRRTPGRPVTYGTTKAFLDHFGLEELRDLPGLDELKGAGLLSTRVPSSFGMQAAGGQLDTLDEDEDPLNDLDLEELGLLTAQ